MAARKTKTLTEQEQLRSTVVKLHLKRYTQVSIAQMVGISQGRVSQILRESIEQWRSRRIRETPEVLIAQKLEQLQEVRSQAWHAWQRSKGDAACTIEEIELRTAYRRVTADCKQEQIPAGESSRLLKVVKKFEARVGANEYLTTILRCLHEEAKLEGLTINNSSVNTPTAWDQLCGRPIEPDAADSCELAL